MKFNRFLAWTNKHKTKINLLLILPILITLVHRLTNHFLQPLTYSSTSRYHLIIIPLAELLLAFFLLDIYQRYRQRTFSPLGWQLILVFLVVNLVLVYFLGQYYQTHAAQGALSARIAVYASLVLLIILIGGVLFSLWKSTRCYTEDAWMNFSFSLPESHPREKRFSILFLVVCFLIGSGIRFYNLGGFPPYIDEYAHTHTAYQLIKHIPVGYDRAFLTVSLPVYLSYLVFGVSLLSGRIPMVLINMLAIFPLFNLVKKVNRHIGYISVILYLFSPWILTVSRTIRDYAIVPIFFYTAALLLMELLDWDGKNALLYLRKNFCRIVAVVLIFGYVIFDFSSILKIIFAPYAIFGVLVILKIITQKRYPWVKFAIISIGMVVLILVVWLTGLLPLNQLEGTFSYRYTQTYWNTVIQSGTHQWYWWGPLGFAIVVLGGILALRSIFKPYNRENFTVLGLFLIFASVLFYLTFFLLINHSVPGHIRYGVLLVYWYLPVMAVVIWVLYRWLSNLFPKTSPVVFLVLLTLIFTNPRSVLSVLTYPGGYAQRVSGEFHTIVEPAYELLAEKMTGEDILLTNIMHSWDEIAGGKLSRVEKIPYSGSVVREGINPLMDIEKYLRGWIAVTSYAGSTSFDLPDADFEQMGTFVHYYGKVGDIYLWYWGNSP